MCSAIIFFGFLRYFFDFNSWFTFWQRFRNSPFCFFNRSTLSCCFVFGLAFLSYLGTPVLRFSADLSWNSESSEGSASSRGRMSPVTAVFSRFFFSFSLLKALWVSSIFLSTSSLRNFFLAFLFSRVMASLRSFLVLVLASSGSSWAGAGSGIGVAVTGFVTALVFFVVCTLKLFGSGPFSCTGMDR
uniref:(northern house mosquito) hypothetical protein n=1 Tax=Culex pipiens TaxID=7175 RepID=A0A8D8K0M1_CULPI